MNNTSVESYLSEGCGRCELFRTPACKVHRWRPVLEAARAVVLEAGVTEAMKWGSPCYTLDGKNVAMLGALKESVMLGFFKGAALADPTGLLESPGPNSRFMRQLRFTSVDEVAARRAAIRSLIEQAMALERAGGRFVPAPVDETLPAELAARLDADPGLRAAFDALTPGRRRSHMLYIADAKKAETRAARVERCLPWIIAGKGYNER